MIYNKLYIIYILSRMDITEHNLNEETTILLTIGRMNPPTTGH